MRAMVLEAVGRPLVLKELPTPEPGPGEVRLRVEACGVCRTDLHVVDGELPDVRTPVIPGHEVIGVVERIGDQVEGLKIGQRVGVCWLGGTCGHCRYCLAGAENLCDAAEFTGYTRPGGFASHIVARAAFCFPISTQGGPVATAPLMCAGLIGWRSLAKAGDAHALGLYGFGAAAHILVQVAVSQGRRVYAFTRPGDTEHQAFAIEQGACWAGSSDALPPDPLDAAILFAPAGELVPLALRAVRKGGRVVCGGIHMSDIPSFPYSVLWEERQLSSVANLTRDDAKTFFAHVRGAPVHTITAAYALDDANAALDALRQGRIYGAAVLVP
ncbi:MAG TPA: zinc-dependent alcohol dehydrogenase family protein [Luteibacter sp.]|uniref:zinc-dependent alcohol dehydrogenase family protein n=1 Tax=Luteibacter sp. TaxID=1886636 RepID=UPI002B8E9D10|nr:zinc-dependent alcohol dehydrogenase family protein [Luteibacter sp.]HVI55977.1 zinc-dependent alcohol dehydrogenase family protein [Luteibacter sp.]